MKTLRTALVAAVLLAGSSAAFAGSRENVAVAVKPVGVNFANPESVAKFQQEVARTIAAACNPGDRIGADMAPDFKCRREMAASMAPKVQQLVMAATGASRMATQGLPN